MRVILCEDVDHLGAMGETVVVKSGYARNFLIPRKLAVSSQSASAKQIDHELRIIKKREEKIRKEQGEYKRQLEGVQLEFTAKASDEGRLFGSVTNMHIADRLAELGHTIDRRKIYLAEPLKSLGEHIASIRLAKGIEAKIKITINKEETAEPVAEEEPFKPETDEDEHEADDDFDDEE